MNLLHARPFSLAIACLFLVFASPFSAESQGVNVSHSSSVSISVEQTNDEAVVKFNNKEVWKGEVRKSVIAVSKSENGNDLAAAFDGRKLLWENVAGAGAKLEEERKAAARRQK